MALMTFDELYALADEKRPRRRVVAAGGADLTVLEAMAEAEQRGWIEPVLTGSRAEIEAVAQRLRVSLDRFRIVEAGADDLATAAVAEVREGRADLLMKGQLPTPQLMKALLNREKGLRTDRVIAQVVLMEIQTDRRAFLMTDTGITIRPTLEQKADLLRSLVDVGACLQRHEPTGLGPSPLRIACMAATEKPNEQMPDTLESEALTQRSLAGEFPGAIVQGPLSFDLAYAAQAGEKKGLANDVIGAADAMLFPDLLSANLTVKAMMYTAPSRFGGVLVGAACPVVFMSRADSTETRLNSLAFTLTRG